MLTGAKLKEFLEIDWRDDILDIEDVKEMARELLSSRWREITPTNLPKVGDEVACFNPPYVSPVAPVYREDAKNTHRDWKADGWTHFRAINPPTHSTAHDTEGDGV